MRRNGFLGRILGAAGRIQASDARLLGWLVNKGGEGPKGLGW